MTETWERVRRARWLAHESFGSLGWPAKVGLAAGFAGFTALLAQVSFPLPWTPVPFSLQPVAVLMAGAALGRAYGFLSVVLYLAAGAVGLQVFADQESPGWQVLTGSTAGYLVGFAAAAYLVGWYVERGRRLLDRRTALLLAGGLGVAATFALVALVWIAFQGGRFESEWSATQSLLWLFVGMGAIAAVAVVWLVRSDQGHGLERLHLFLVMVAALVVIHLCGVVVLKPSLGVGWSEAIALGSTVFLPFDLVKAGLATAASVPFLPTQADDAQFPRRGPHA